MRETSRKNGEDLIAFHQKIDNERVYHQLLLQIFEVMKNLESGENKQENNDFQNFKFFFCNCQTN